MMSIYRFTSIERFYEIVKTKSLSLVLPELWPDPYEGFLFRAVETQDGIKKVEDSLLRVAPDQGKFGIQIALLSNFKRARYGQCWSKCAENDSFWKTYQIRIEASRNDISDLDNLDAYDVTYVDFLDLDEELRTLFSYPDEKSITIESQKALLQKRKEFSHEQEVRLLTNAIQDNIAVKNPPLLELVLKIEQGKICEKDFIEAASKLPGVTKEIPKIKKISFKHSPGFLKSVMLSPFATSEDDKSINQFCEENKLNYLGKSEMYTFKI